VSLREAIAELDVESLGDDMHALVADLFPICRSITGDGFRQTLAILDKRVPLEVHEVPSGTRAFDWTVPPEWNLRDAYVADLAGNRVIDVRASNLHVMSYSVPTRRRVTRSELDEHLHSLPEHLEWIPYRTSYYRPDWGFCLSERQRAGLSDPEYDVVVDSTLEDGSLTYGELVVPGETQDEVLVTAHACHPSMANDNLSGVALVAFLAEILAAARPRRSYRFLFIPGTIGSITWLSRNEAVVPRIVAGLVVACVGDGGPLTYKSSQRGDALVDRAAAHVMRRRGGSVRAFTPYGYDERQFNSPGFDLPVGCLSRTPHGEFPEYHTSADDLELVRPESLAGSLAAALDIVRILDEDAAYVNRHPKGEPQLGSRGLYPSTGGRQAEEGVLAMLWVLNQSNGGRSLLDIADRAALPFDAIQTAATTLAEAGLLAVSSERGDDDG
jgi:aminopeptidase-like protein